MTVADVVGWATVALLLLLCVTEWVGFDAFRPVAIAQSFTPFACACAVPIAVVAIVTGRPAMAALCIPPVATGAWLALPMGRRDTRPVADGCVFTVAFGNLLSKNTRAADALAAMAATDADVMVLLEFTPSMRDTLDDLCGSRYPHRAEALSPDPAGIGVWSRLPFASGGPTDIVGRASIDVVVRLGDDAVRVLAVHTTPPTIDAPGWCAELRAIRSSGVEGDRATVLIGDFNAARWHPTFRSLLRAGWQSVHEALGKGWSPSWPTAHYPAPIFLRVDHALLRGPVRAVSVREIEIPGSDHRGFVAELSLTHP